MMKIKNTMLLYCSFMFVGCIAMDSDDRDLNHHIAVIGGQIDKNILGINENAWLTPIIGSCTSFYQSFSFFSDPQKARQELSAVETVIQQASDRAYSPKLFKALHTKHWHFAYLVNALVHDEIQQLSKADGFTIDMLCDKKRKLSHLSPQLSTFIHARAHDTYAQQVGLKKPIMDINFGGKQADEEDIHCVVLESNTSLTTFKHEPCLLMMYDGGKYFRSVDPSGTQILWDSKTAKELKETPSFTHVDGQCYKDNYLINSEKSMVASCGYPSYGWQFRSIIKKYQKDHNNYLPAMLFMRPTLASWLCQQIFLKNKNNKDQLIALRDCQAIKSIEGFPQQNLLQLIDKVLSK